MRTTINIVTIFMMTVSLITTWQGLHYAATYSETAFTREVTPGLVAIATFCIATLFWMMLFKYYPRLQKIRKHMLNTVVIPIMCFLIFCSSTIWSIIGIGGASATLYHLNLSTSKTRIVLQSLYSTTEADRYLVSATKALKNQFSTLQNNEQLGGISSLNGQGEVYNKLKALTSSFSTLEKECTTNLQVKLNATEDIQNIAKEIDKIQGDNKISLQQKADLASAKLSEINQLISKVQETNSFALVKQFSMDIDDLSAATKPYGNDPKATYQTLGLQQVNLATVAAQQILKDVVNKAPEKIDINLETKKITQSQACLMYPETIIPEIIIAIALDFAPSIFLIFLVLAASSIKEDEEATLQSLHEEQPNAEQS